MAEGHVNSIIFKLTTVMIAMIMIMIIIIIIISTQTQVPVLKVITLQWDRINNFRFT